ncbi:hypothetical protein K501DRAFT_91412 [Backusella circina FSU 941]|nr:hypothetical protein K501DRAFT_91412 [Backusella circina FSU 941]
MFAPRTASIVLVPVTSFAGYATYARASAKPTKAHSELMTVRGIDEAGRKQWRRVNNGLGLVDVGRSGGGL